MSHNVSGYGPVVSTWCQPLCQAIARWCQPQTRNVSGNSPLVSTCCHTMCQAIAPWCQLGVTQCVRQLPVGVNHRLAMCQAIAPWCQPLTRNVSGNTGTRTGSQVVSLVSAVRVTKTRLTVTHLSLRWPCINRWKRFNLSPRVRISCALKPIRRMRYRLQSLYRLLALYWCAS